MTITTKYTTYRTTGYTHQVGSDARATGGVHHHEIRRTASGCRVRIAETNGRYLSYGPSTPATADQIATAQAAK